eukprot:CAMPEP_0178988706 /NCGR_PEP_ID=MMETSP0795-20121207/3952_1 /TAXON_ID=88552 /ORGANISM="Amoebophrya sp., Strain Ameob2" /LENGTH=427 /DNA_ID=CAMNT_0020679995 /DNA_START=135 /DNA_END=1418 /DNA_ORIENTATION=-
MKSLTSRVLAVLGTSGSGIMSEAFLLSTRLREDSSTASCGGDEGKKKNPPAIGATPGGNDDVGPAEAPPGGPVGPKPGPPGAKPGPPGANGHPGTNGPPGANGPSGPNDSHTPVLNPQQTEDDFYNDVKWQCMKTDKKGDNLPFGPGPTFQPLYYIEHFDRNSATFKELHDIRNGINKVLGPDEIRPPHLTLIDMIMSKKHGDQIWKFLESKKNSAEVAALKADARKIVFDEHKAWLTQLNPKALVLEYLMPRPSLGMQPPITTFRTRFYQLLQKLMAEHCPGQVNVCREQQWSTQHVVFACGDNDPWFAINSLWWGKGVMRPHSTIASNIGFWALAARKIPGKKGLGHFGSPAIEKVVAKATAADGLDGKAVQELTHELINNGAWPAASVDPHGPGQIHHAEISRGHQPCRNLLPAEPETINLGKP